MRRAQKDDIAGSRGRESRVSAGPASNRRAVLLRGINVGKAKRIAMADLRRVLVELGYAEVRTLLNSGNAVLGVPRGGATDHAARIEKAIAEGLGVTTRAFMLRSEELAAAVRGNPLAARAVDPARMLLMSLADTRAQARFTPLLAKRWSPEALAVSGRFAYLWCANGIGTSPLWLEVNRAVGDAGTARNLATMTKLLAMVDETS